VCKPATSGLSMNLSAEKQEWDGYAMHTLRSRD
jgi:hypothetical protein